MPLPRHESIGRLIIIVPVVLAGLYGLLAGILFQTITPEQQWWLGFFG
jgi:hypothetical protein